MTLTLERGFLQFLFCRLPQTITAKDTAAAAHPVRLATMVAARHQVGERRSTATAKWLPNRVGRLTLRAGHFLCNSPSLQVCLDFSAGEVPRVDIFREIDLDQLKQPALLARLGVWPANQLGLQLPRRVKSFRCLSRGQVVERAK